MIFKKIEVLATLAIPVFGIFLYFFGSRYLHYYFEYWQLLGNFSASDIKEIASLGAFVLGAFLVESIFIILGIMLVSLIVFICFTFLMDKFDNFINDRFLKNIDDGAGNKNKIGIANDKVNRSKERLLAYKVFMGLLITLLVILIFTFGVNAIDLIAKKRGLERGEQIKILYDQVLNDESKVTNISTFDKAQLVTFANGETHRGIVIACNETFCAFYLGGGNRRIEKTSNIETIHSSIN